MAVVNSGGRPQRYRPTTESLGRYLDRGKVLTPEKDREIDQRKVFTPRNYSKLDQDKVLGTDLRFFRKFKMNRPKGLKKTGRNPEIYSKQGMVWQLFHFQKWTVKQTEEGSLLLKRTEKEPVKVLIPKKGTEEETGEGSYL